MKRRRCTTCPLLEPHDEPWTGNQCPICVSAGVRIDPPQVIVEKQKRPYTITDAVLKARRAKYEPGLCRQCWKRKPIDQFPPRCNNEPEWREHHRICKECVAEKVLAIHVRKRAEAQQENMKYWSKRRLSMSLKSHLRAVERIREEIMRRKQIDESVAS